MSSVLCLGCGAPLAIDAGTTTVTCGRCGASRAIPQAMRDALLAHAARTAAAAPAQGTPPAFSPLRSGVLPWLLAVALLGLGAGGVALVGLVSRRNGPKLNLLFVGMGAVFAGLGARTLQRPTSVQIVRDASFYGARQATRTEGLVFGAAFVALGVALVVFGIFVGGIAD
jgi:hypothetical protein